MHEAFCTVIHYGSISQETSDKQLVLHPYRHPVPLLPGVFCMP